MKIYLYSNCLILIELIENVNVEQIMKLRQNMSKMNLILNSESEDDDEIK